MSVFLSLEKRVVEKSSHFRDTRIPGVSRMGYQDSKGVGGRYFTSVTNNLFSV